FNPYLEIEVSGHKCKTQLTGKYNLANISAAIAVGREFGVPEQKIREAIASYLPENARSQIIQKGDVTIILDAYNANPDSMKVALESLADHEGRKMAILGDMNELENPDESHTHILKVASDLNIEIKTIGDKIGRVAPSKTHFSSKEELEKNLQSENFSNTIVLLKASRSIKLETILNSIN
ncbi:MAG: glutamate ligase domain-containing protein, partial [Ekhidna sp.]